MIYENTRIYILEIIDVKIIPRFIQTKFAKAALATPSMIITAQFALMANHLTIVTLNGLLVEAIYCQVIGPTTLFTVVLFMWFGLFIRSDKSEAFSVTFSILMTNICFLTSSAPKGSTCIWTVSFGVSGAISWFVSSSPSGEHGVSICTLPLRWVSTFSAISEHIFMSTVSGTAPIWMPQNTIDDELTLIWTMVCCRQATLPEPMLIQIHA